MSTDCVECGEPLTPIKIKRRAITRGIECRRRRDTRKYSERNPHRLRGLSTVLSGAAGELVVSVDLLLRGFYVFRAVSPSSPCDLIVLIDGRAYRVEVRTAYVNIGGEVRVGIKQDAAGKYDVVAAVTYDPEPKVTYRLPDGLKPWEWPKTTDSPAI